MAADDEDSVFGKPRPKPTVHVIGQILDDLSAPELDERIAVLRSEIERLEAAIRQREATRHAASAFFKK